MATSFPPSHTPVLPPSVTSNYKLGATSSCEIPVLPVITFAYDTQGPFREGTDALVTVVRTGDNTTAVTVKYKTSSSTAYATQVANDNCATAADFQTTSGVLAFDVGVVERTLVVPILNDSIWEQAMTKYDRLAVHLLCSSIQPNPIPI